MPERIELEKHKFEIQVWTKSQIAEAYNISTKTLKKKLEDCQIYTQRNKTLSPKQALDFFNEYGWPPKKPRT